MIRLFVIEDHPVIVTGLRNLFRPSRDEIEVIDNASSVDDVVMRANPTTFDIFLMELWLPNSHPLLNVKKLKDNFKGKPIVIFTSEDSSSWQRKMFEAGVMAYLLKSTSKVEIKATLEKVITGKKVLPTIIEQNYAKERASVLSSKKFYLTPNQQEEFVMLSSGVQKQKIAEAKKITPHVNSPIMIVHGHDEEMKKNVQLFLSKAKITDIVLHEQPDKGRTIMEKLVEEGSRATYAIALLSPDDILGDGTMRARQNVIFEIGYFIGRLGRERVKLLIKGDVEIPGDLDGILYEAYDTSGSWRIKIAKELQHLGFYINLKNLIKKF